MSNVLEYILRLRDEFSSVLKGAAGASVNSLTDVAGGALVVMNHFDRLASVGHTALAGLTGDSQQLGSLFAMLPGPIGVASGAIVSELGKVVDSLTKTADGFRLLKEKTGGSIEFLSSFTEAADDVFVKQETVNASLTIFARKLGGVEDAMDGSGVSANQFAQKLKEIGVESTDIESAMMAVMDRFAGMKDGTEKAALAVQLFGRAGTDMIPILNKGSAGFQEMAAAAKAAGMVITDETVASVQELKRNQDELNDTMEGLGRAIASAVIPKLNDATHALREYNVEAKEAARIDAEIRFNLTESTVDYGAYGYALSQARVEQAKVTAEMQKQWQVTSAAHFDEALDKQRLKWEALQDTWEQVYAKRNLTNEALRVANTSQTDMPEWGYDEAARKAIDDHAYAVNFADDRQKALALSAALAAEKEKALAESFAEVGRVIGGTIGPMEQFERVQTVLSLVSGKQSKDQFERAQATEALGSALKAGIINEGQAESALARLAAGTLSAGDAFKIAGSAGKDFKTETDAVLAAVAKTGEALDASKWTPAMQKRVDGAMARQDKRDAIQAAKEDAAELAAAQRAAYAEAAPAELVIDTKNAALSVAMLHTDIGALTATPVVMKMESQGWEAIKAQYDSITDKSVTITINTRNGLSSADQQSLDDVVARETRARNAAGSQ